MNHYYGNLPDGCTQADIDRAFGPSLSGDAEDALTAHHRVQTLRMTLLEALRANEGVMGFDRYEDLEAALTDAEYTGAQLEDIVAEEDAARAADARQDAAERRAEARLDREGA